MSKAAKYPKHQYDDERELRIQAENKCATCPFVKHTQVAVINKPAEPQNEKKEGES